MRVSRARVHWQAVLGTINIIILALLAACTSEATRRAPSWRKLEIHALELDPSSHLVLFTGVSPSRDRGNASALYMSKHACSRLDLTYNCCSTLYFDTSCPAILTPTLESHMEPARGTALSILTSIGSDMHECRLACKPMYMHHTHWSAGHPSSHPNVPSRFAKHQG